MGMYVFHQLVGTRHTSTVLASLDNIDQLLASDRRSGVDLTDGFERAFNQSSATRGGDSPVLPIGAILAGSGLPLVLDIRRTSRPEQWQLGESDNASTARFVRELDVAGLQTVLLSDAKIAFTAVLSVLTGKTRVVQESACRNFVEGQWLLLEVFVPYWMHHYSEDLDKLDCVCWIGQQLFPSLILSKVTSLLPLYRPMIKQQAQRLLASLPHRPPQLPGFICVLIGFHHQHYRLDVNNRPRSCRN